MTAILLPSAAMSLDPTRAPSGVDDNMEIAFDIGQYYDDDIVLDLDEDDIERQDQAMNDDNLDNLSPDDDMKDDIDYTDDVLDDADEELEDPIEEQPEQDVEVADVAQDGDQPLAEVDVQLRAEPEPGLQDPPNGIPSPTSGEHDLSVGGRVGEDASAAVENPYDNQRERTVLDDAHPEGPLDNETVSKHEHDIDQHEDVGDKHDSNPLGNNQHQYTDAQHEYIEDYADEPQDSYSAQRVERRASFEEDVPPTPPLALSKEQLFSFPMTLHFAGTENNLFPLIGDQEPAPGYLLEDRKLMRKSIKSVFEAFRDRFGRAISENSLLGLEFPDLDMKLNEESPYAAEAGCCLLSFVDIYVKLSNNDGEHDPPPFALNLIVEDRFYSRFQYLRNALNEGKGLSEVVQDEEFEESYEEYDGGDEYQEGADGESYVEDEQFEGSDQLAEGPVKAEGVEGDERVVVNDHNEKVPYEVNSQQNGASVEKTEKQDEAQVLRDVHAKDSRRVDVARAPYIVADDVDSKSAVTTSIDHKKPLETPDDADNSNNEAKHGDYAPKALSDEGQAFLEDSTIQPNKSDNAAVNSSTSSYLKVDDSTRAHEEEESLIDYSDEEMGKKDPAQGDDPQRRNEISSPGHEKKRKRAELEDNKTRNGDGPNKSQKRDDTPAPISGQETEVQPEGEPAQEQDIAASGPVKTPAAPSASPAIAEEEEDLIIDYGDDEHVALANQLNSAQEGVEDRDQISANASTDVNGHTSTASIPHATAVAPADEEEDLINYGSDPECDEQAKTSRVTATVPEASTIAAKSGQKPSPDEEEDLIDYDED